MLENLVKCLKVIISNYIIVLSRNVSIYNNTNLNNVNNNKQLEIVQSINTKEIWYLLGLIESDGVLICFNEK